MGEDRWKVPLDDCFVVRLDVIETLCWAPDVWNWWLFKKRKRNEARNFFSIKRASKTTELCKTKDESNITCLETWPTVVVTGITGFPPAEGAGNVLRAKTKAKISFRLPPTFNCKESEKIIIETLTKDPPYNSKITVKVICSGNGWAAKDMHPSLKKSFSESSITVVVVCVNVFPVLWTFFSAPGAPSP